MPVVVTGASGLVGRHAVAALARVSPEVRAYVRRRDAAPALRTLGAKVAVGAIDDRGTLATVMSGAHTVCHLAGGLLSPRGTYEEDIVGTLRPVLEAAENAGVRRLLYLSYPGASPDAANPYLRAKGEAEALMQDTGMEHVVIRCTLVYGPRGEWIQAALRRARRRPALVVGSGRQVLAPAFVEDVAAVLAAADDRAGAVNGTWGLEGPDPVTADQLADLLAGRRTAKIHLSVRAAAAWGRLGGSSVPLPALEVLAADSVADRPDASAEFGVRRTPLSEGLARSVDGRAE